MGAQAAIRSTATAHTALQRIAAGGMIVGSVALILGALMPWAKLTVPIAGTLTRTGLDSGADAVFCVAVGVAACLMGLRTLLTGGPAAAQATERSVAGVVGVLGLVCVVFAAVAAKHVDDRLGSLLDHVPGFARGLVSGEIGSGIWVVGAGGAVIALCALVQVLASGHR